MKRILFCTGEGIGNFVQTIPVIRTLKEVLGYKVDVWWAFSSYLYSGKMIPYADRMFFGQGIEKAKADDYVGKVATTWVKHLKDVAQLSKIKLLNEIKPLRMDRSEVDIYMDIARELGAEEKDLLWHGNCNYGEVEEKYDIVIHNGYNIHGSADWSIKSYPHYEELVEYLEGLSVCSVGAKHEYINGTKNETNKDLMYTLGLIKNCRLFLGNDSGLYHCANALEKDNIVLFTATSIAKNYNRKFHKYSTVITRDDLECRPCQANRGWKNCITKDCKEIDPEVILNAIKMIIQARFMSDAGEYHGK